MEVPAVGLGTLGLRESAEATVEAAVCEGCLMIDTSEHYGNLETLRVALASAEPQPSIILKLSGLPSGSYVTVRARVTAMLEKLGLKHAALCLIHWPGLYEWDPTDNAPLESAASFREKVKVSTWDDYRSNIKTAWENMKQLKEEGLVWQIGTSNFYQPHLDELTKQCGNDAKPFANEIFIDAANQELEFVEAMQAQGIRVISYRPFGCRNCPDVIEKVAERLSASRQSVVLAWLLRRGVWPLVKCRGVHVKENLNRPEELKSQLSDDDLRDIKSADAGGDLALDWFAKIWKRHQELGAISEDDVAALTGIFGDEAKARAVLEKHGGNLDIAMEYAFIEDE